MDNDEYDDSHDWCSDPFPPPTKGEIFAFALIAWLVAFIIGAGLWTLVWRILEASQ